MCASILRKRLFTIAAMDNIEHNPTATTAITSCISRLHYQTQINEGEKREPFKFRDHSVKKVYASAPRMKPRNRSCLPTTFI